MTPEEIWRRFKPGWLTKPGAPDVNVYHVGDVDRQAVAAIAAAIVQEREASVQILTQKLYRIGKDSIGVLGPSRPANEVIRECITAIRAITVT